MRAIADDAATAAPRRREGPGLLAAISAFAAEHTTVSLGAGGSGGIVTPIFFVGATAGSTVGGWLGFDRGTFAAIGLVSMLAGATNAPLAASIVAIELVGPRLPLSPRFPVS